MAASLAEERRRLDLSTKDLARTTSLLEAAEGAAKAKAAAFDRQEEALEEQKRLADKATEYVMKTRKKSAMKGVVL